MHKAVLKAINGVIKLDDKEKVYKNLRVIGEKIEELGLGCIIVDNPFRARDKKDVGRATIITQPNPLEQSYTEEEFENLLEEIRGYINRISLDFGFLGLGPGITVDSLSSWFAFLDKEGKHPILSGDLIFKGTDMFLSKVVFGQERHRLLIQEFQKKYGPNFIQDCYDIYAKELERGKQRLEDFNRELREEIEERKQQFNKYEIAEIKDFLLVCIEKARENRISAIVGIDCSGRPLANMFWQLLKKNNYSPMPFLDFLDIHQLSKKLTWQETDKPLIPDIFLETFKKEFTSLNQVISRGNGKIFVIDDQIFSYMHTLLTVRQLFNQLTEKENGNILFRVVSAFNGYNGLTWWKDKSFLRVRNNMKCPNITLRAIPRKINTKQEARIRNFEERLTEITEEVFQSLKKFSPV